MSVEARHQGEKGTLPNYSYTFEYVSPGHLVLSARRTPTSTGLTVSAEIRAGQTYYFKIYQTASGLFINNHFEMVSPEVAIADPQELKRRYRREMISNSRFQGDVAASRRRL